MTVLAVFKSRAQTLDFVSLLRSGGVVASAVNTPKEAGVGCGISAKFDERFFPREKLYLLRGFYAPYGQHVCLRALIACNFRRVRI